MISLRLKLFRRPSLAPATQGWFIPGDDPAAWLRELDAAGVSTADRKLYAVPRSLADRRPCGLLVAGAAARLPSPLCVPCARIGAKLFVPLDALLEPDVTVDELDRGLAYDVVLFHPSVGLVGFTRDDALGPRDLLLPPPQGTSEWDAAQSGPCLPDRMIGVEMDEPPPLEQILRAAKDDIGRDPVQPAPGGTIDTLRRGAGKIVALGGMGAAWTLYGITKLAPGTSDVPTWIDDVRNWAAEKISRMSEALARLRHGEIDRLIRTLEKDPSAGLKMALPLSDLPGRGIAPPGASLVSRNVDFNLGDLGGGRPVDPWDIDPGMYGRLRILYERAAAHELALGRFRRAAYIFAHLLGDFARAADALERGAHYSEASVLYKDKLNQPMRAAECLEKGGAFTAAAALYEEHREYVKAGDLWSRQGRVDKADRDYRLAVDRCLKADHWQEAGKLLETNLRVPDEALELYASKWPDLPGAEACLEERFALLGRLNRHDEAAALLRSLKRTEPDFVLALARALSRVAGRYPEPTVRRLAADATRVAAGLRLTEASRTDAADLTRAVARLDPSDFLLGRDARRFLERHWTAPPPARPHQKPPQPVASYRLGPALEWKAAAGNGSEIYGLCTDEKSVVIISRAGRDGTIARRALKWPGPPSSDWSIAAAPAPAPRIVISTPDTTLVVPRISRLPEDDSVTPLPFEFSAIAFDPQGNLLGVQALGLNLITINSALRVIGASELPSQDPPTHVVASEDAVFFAANSVLHMLRHNAWSLGGAMRGPILSLTAASAFSRTRVVATFDLGGLVAWGKSEWGKTQTFGEGLISPRAAFTQRGDLVAVSVSGEGRVYDAADGRVTLLSEFHVDHTGSLLGLFPLGGAAFAVVFADGAVRVFD